MRVVNASPLIHLARVSLLELLRGASPPEEVVVPEAVYDEVMRGAGYDASAHLVEDATNDWLFIVPTPPPDPLIDRSRIDAGEIAVLSVALASQGASVVLDDLAARIEADRLNIPRTGTLRLLIDGKQLGIIPSVRPFLEHLRSRGMRLSDAIFLEDLNQAGE
jgi:predicted nucleic acid-binding protein